ncbi:MAG: helix-turn-helix domain-containing protein [Dehalobacter sp.]|nr:helix-turn-helix domain-containing protein [Dehalobacter sp.]
MVVDWDKLPVNLVPEIIWKEGIIPLGKQAIYELCHRPGFPVVKIGKKFIIPRDSLRRWLEKNAGI